MKEEQEMKDKGKSPQERIMGEILTLEDKLIPGIKLYIKVLVKNEETSCRIWHNLFQMAKHCP